MTDMVTSKHIGWATCMGWLVVDWAVLGKCGGGGGVRLCVCVSIHQGRHIYTDMAPNFALVQGRVIDSIEGYMEVCNDDIR